MSEPDDFIWLPILPKEMQAQLRNLPEDQKQWPEEFRDEFRRRMSEFTQTKAEFARWIRKDRNSRVNRTAKLILLYILDCANFKTGRCDPGHQTIADELGIGLSTVERYMSAFDDWCDVVRRGKGNTNFYRFRARKTTVNALLDLSTDLRDMRAEERERRRQIEFRPADEPSLLRDQASSDPSLLRAPDPSLSMVPDPSLSRDKYVSGTCNAEHASYISCSEGGEITYTREGIPADEDEFGSWVRANIPDPTNHREAFRLLRERKMTPEILKGMAA